MKEGRGVEKCVAQQNNKKEPQSRKRKKGKGLSGSTVQPRLSPNFSFSWLSFLSVKFISPCYHVWPLLYCHFTSLALEDACYNAQLAFQHVDCYYFKVGAIFYYSLSYTPPIRVQTYFTDVSGNKWVNELLASGKRNRNIKVLIEILSRGALIIWKVVGRSRSACPCRFLTFGRMQMCDCDLIHVLKKWSK